MEILLVGRAQQIFDGDIYPGDDWDELEIDTWDTLRLIQKDEIGPDFSGQNTGYLFQYVRCSDSPEFDVKFSLGGKFAILVGYMRTENRVEYHDIALYPG